MPRQVELDGVIHQFPDDFTDQDVSAALAQVSGETSGPKSAVRKRQEILAGRAAAEAEAAQAPADAIRQLLKQDLPSALSTAGSLWGPPGAGIGAGAGAALYQTAKAGAGEGFDPGAVAKEAALAYGGAKAGQLFGKGIGKLSGVVSGSIRQRAVAKAAEKYAQATAQGKLEPTGNLLIGLGRMTQRAGAAGQREVDHLVEQARNFLSNKPGSLTPTVLHEIRQVMDDIAQPYYNAVGKFKPPPEAAEAARVRFAKLIADNARAALRRLVPEAQPFERTASRAITARKFLPIGSPTHAGRQILAGAAGTAGFLAGGPPVMAAGGLSAAILSQPEVAMALARLAEHPLMAQLLTQSLSQAGRQTAQTVGGSQ